MKLPNGENAVVEIEKLTDYLLSSDHPRGKHKARVLAAACGLRAEHADLFRQELLIAARNGDAVERLFDAYGQRFVIEWNVAGPAGEVLLITA
jgi:hypothetical protein